MSVKPVQNPPVKVGQVWRDNDPRAEGKQFRIDSISNGFIRVVGLESGVKTRISKSRFNLSGRHRGYTLVLDAPAPVEYTAPAIPPAAMA